MHSYSAILVVGGDGSFHEVFNGMLMRKDQLRLPIGLIPNGSGNDFNSSFGVVKSNIDLALDFIIKGNTMKIDVVKCILDYDKLEDIPEDKVFTNFRFGCLSMMFGLIAKIVHRAASYKKCCCGNPYLMAAVREFIKGETDIFTIEVDE